MDLDSAIVLASSHVVVTCIRNYRMIIIAKINAESEQKKRKK